MIIGLPGTSLDLLSKLSVVIPSIDHPNLLERSIEYWRSLPIQVHILDGSHQPNFKETDFSGLQIKYHHLPWSEDNDRYSNFCNLMCLGTKLTDSKYSVICGDDDFFTVSGMLKAIATLEAKPQIDAVTGRTVYYKEGLEFKRWSMKGLSRTFSPLMESESLETRMLLSNAPWIMYAICRTGLWRQLFDISFSNRIENSGAHELLVRELSPMMFRSTLIGDVLSVRQVTIPGSNPPDPVTLSSWIKIQMAKDNCRVLREKIISALNFCAPNYSESQIDSTVNQVLKKYAEPDSDSKMDSRSHPSIVARARKALIKATPENLKYLASFILEPRSVLQGRRSSLRVFLYNLRRSGIGFEGYELTRISEIVSNPDFEFTIRAKISHNKS